MSEVPPQPSVRRRWRSVVPAPLRHGVVLFLVLLIVEYFVVPEFVVAGKNLHVLTHLNIVWLVAGVVLEGGALFCYALLTRTLLPGGGPGISTLFRIDLSTTAIADVIPAGSAGSAGLGYRLLTTHGVEGGDAAFAMATQGVGSAVILNVMLWFALVISIPIAGYKPIYVIVALVGMLVVLLGVAALVYTFIHGEQNAVRLLRAVGAKIPRVGPDRLEHVAQRISNSLRDLAANREVLRMALMWAALNWLLDAASLWSFLAALGHYVDPFELFAAYGIANVLAVIPLTPGGLGLIDASAPALLLSFGVPGKIATLGVIGWRLVNFWLPIPVGAGAYLSLRVPRGAGMKVHRQALREMAHPAGAGDLSNAPRPGEPQEPS